MQKHKASLPVCDAQLHTLEALGCDAALAAAKSSVCLPEMELGIIIYRIELYKLHNSNLTT